MTTATNTDRAPRYRSNLPSPPTEIVTLASPATPVPVTDFEDIFMMSPINTKAETETDNNAAPMPMSFEIPLGPLSSYGGALKPAPKYKKPATQLTKPMTEQPDYAYLFKGYDADALVLRDQQINSPGQAVDGKQHHAEPSGQSPIYGETDSDDGDPFIYDHILLPSSSYHNTLVEADPPSDNNSFEYGSTFASDYDDDTFEVQDNNDDDVGSEPDSEPPSSPSSEASRPHYDGEADSEDNDDDDDDESHDSNDDDDGDDEDEEDEQNNNEYSDDNESGDSSSRCSVLSSHPLLQPPPIYAMLPYLTYQSPPTAPTMMPPAPHNTPLALPSTAPPIILPTTLPTIPLNIPLTILLNNPRFSNLGTLEILDRHIRDMIYGLVLADYLSAPSEELSGVDPRSDVAVRNSIADRNNMLLVCWTMRGEVLDFLARPFSSSGDELDDELDDDM
ncbi:hypothetical protein COCMIDRAFT_105272 [Bipolaris oryzae ATCC 44560]|uniref:Uncharacterized protein n=1 Tax=Bipolaris oryzae ATCC 44560 TaxID=930090 RepID=W6Z2B6_COCMI|nr:uncharacterized protein COCMIDRAFT_105272 [Bipolaris oryzae ATCC 44560]EUC41779.1 hypothetical protein COCMIDRAFT_105272 [Bipolaris oryzae ATCC 44560]